MHKHEPKLEEERWIDKQYWSFRMTTAPRCSCSLFYLYKWNTTVCVSYSLLLSINNRNVLIHIWSRNLRLDKRRISKPWCYRLWFCVWS
jgi:hypothetical protein